MAAPVTVANPSETLNGLAESWDRPRHVVQISSDRAVFSDEGQEPRNRQRLYSELLRRQAPGSHLTLLVLTHQRDALPIEEEGLSFVPVVKWTAGARGRLGWWRQLWDALTRLHRARPVDVLAPQALNEEAWIAYFFARRHGVPMVGQIHFDPFNPLGRLDNYGSGALGLLRGALSRALIPRMQAVRTVAQAVTHQLEEIRATKDCHTIPVPVAMVSNPARTGGGASEPLVLFVGRLCAAKNLSDWIRIAHRVSIALPNATFEIVGDGELRSQLEALALAAGINERVHFRGFVPYRLLTEYYRRAAVFLMTSHYEGCPRVLVEAAANGLPAVAPRLAGIEDIITDGETGYLVQPGDIDQYVARVSRLLCDAALRQRLGAAASQLVRLQFDPEMLATRWVSLLLDVANRGRSAPC